jgi:hypothetical protein
MPKLKNTSLAAKYTDSGYYTIHIGRFRFRANFLTFGLETPKMSYDDMPVSTERKFIKPKHSHESISR